MSQRWLLLGLCLLAQAGSIGSEIESLGTNRFEALGVPVRKGGLMGCIVGPNGQGGEALYFNFNQAGAPLFLVQVDPDTGRARQFAAPQGPGAWAFAVGPDEKVYLGTWSGALILRFDPKQPDKGIEVVGKPAASEDYLWQYAVGKDGKLYACTYPNAKLVRYDPATGQMEDLGRMHPTEMYARSLAAGADGNVYVGIGMEQSEVVVFEPGTGQHRGILPAALKAVRGGGAPHVMRAGDGQVYAYLSKWMRLEHGAATVIDTEPAAPPLRLRDGRVVTAFGRGSFSLQDPLTKAVVERTFSYAGAGDMIFVVGNGPDGRVYGSTAMPLEVFRYDPREKRSEHLGGMPGGEVYSMIEQGQKLYLCYYGGAIMNLYDPAKPFWKWGATPDCNPVSFGGIGDGHLRPRAMIRGPGSLIYVGSEPPYGQLGGALGVWDPHQNKTIENYRHLVTNQSIVSLAYEPRSGLIFGGSGNYGGGGTRPSEKEAVFFAFDPVKKQKVFEAALVPGASRYPATCAVDGKVFTTVGNKLFLFDPAGLKVTRTIALPGTQVDISLAWHRSGRLYGLTSTSVYAVDPATGEVTHSARAPVPVNCGFALTDDALYFGSSAQLWRYRLPPR